MKSEKIIRVGKIVYAKLFDVLDENFICFVDNDGYTYEGDKLFWRFYWVNKINY